MTGTTISEIRLELARSPGFPQGDPNHAYRLHLPLDAEGRIDGAAFRDTPPAWRVRRSRPGEADAHGRILRGPGGRFFFDYDDRSAHDDEAGFRFAEERFVVGEYVSIRDDDGEMRTFRVVSVRED